MKTKSFGKGFKLQEFKPQLTPKEMLELGVFGGWYFKEKENMIEYPKDWFESAKISEDGFDIKLNCFNIKAGTSMKDWTDAGWITPEDPLGWFQWYCRYYMGRRITDIDKYQIRRYNNFGPRFVNAILKNCSGEYDKRIKSRQSLLQWGYDPYI